MRSVVSKAGDGEGGLCGPMVHVRRMHCCVLLELARINRHQAAVNYAHGGTLSAEAAFVLLAHELKTEQKSSL
jgi:hypothetical protein